MNDKLEEILASIACYATIAIIISSFSYVIYLYLKI